MSAPGLEAQRFWGVRGSKPTQRDLSQTQSQPNETWRRLKANRMQTGSQPDADLTQTPSPPSPTDSKPTQRDLAQTPSQPIDADDDQSHDDEGFIRPYQT
jgi:hypothetical protein